MSLRLQLVLCAVGALGAIGCAGRSERVAPAEARHVRYSCDQGVNLSVVFGDHQARVLTEHDPPLDLPRQTAASGFLYETPTHSIRGEGQSLTYTIGRMAPIQCRELGS